MNLNAITEKFDITRPAISNHIKILTECGLIIITQHGRERICRAKPDGLKEVETWVQQYNQFWTNKFDSLENFLKTKNNKK
jgi:DNA-binding transcriptional ArsR family regulator